MSNDDSANQNISYNLNILGETNIVACDNLSLSSILSSDSSNSTSISYSLLGSWPSGTVIDSLTGNIINNSTIDNIGTYYNLKVRSSIDNKIIDSNSITVVISSSSNNDNSHNLTISGNTNLIEGDDLLISASLSPVEQNVSYSLLGSWPSETSISSNGIITGKIKASDLSTMFLTDLKAKVILSDNKVVISNSLDLSLSPAIIVTTDETGVLSCGMTDYTGPNTNAQINVVDIGSKHSTLNSSISPALPSFARLLLDYSTVGTNQTSRTYDIILDSPLGNNSTYGPYTVNFSDDNGSTSNSEPFYIKINQDSTVQYFNIGSFDNAVMSSEYNNAEDVLNSSSSDWLTSIPDYLYTYAYYILGPVTNSGSDPIVFSGTVPNGMSVGSFDSNYVFYPESGHGSDVIYGKPTKSNDILFGTFTITSSENPCVVKKTKLGPISVDGSIKLVDNFKWVYDNLSSIENQPALGFSIPSDGVNLIFYDDDPGDITASVEDSTGVHHFSITNPVQFGSYNNDSSHKYFISHLILDNEFIDNTSVLITIKIKDNRLGGTYSLSPKKFTLVPIQL